MQTHAQNYSAHVDRGPSRGSSVFRPGNEDPHWHGQKLINYNIFATAGWETEREHYTIQVEKSGRCIKSELWLVDRVHEGSLGSAIIGENKLTL